jgi:hypothetical protein
MLIDVSELAKVIKLTHLSQQDVFHNISQEKGSQVIKKTI